MNNQTAMTKTERQELASLVRKNAKVQRAVAAERAAQLLNEFEQQLDRHYSYDEEEFWRQGYAEAQEAIDRLNAAITRRCDERGIPRDFRPHASCFWSERGRNAMRQERADMRRVAHAQIEAMQKRRLTEIARWETERETQLVAGALTSEAAHAFLAQMPEALERVMFSLDVQQIADQVSGKRALLPEETKK